MKKLFTFFLLIFSIVDAFSQARVEGTVIDNKTQLPIRGVTVFIKNLKKGTTTDSIGRFELNVPFGDYFLNFSAVGYRPKNRFAGMTVAFTKLYVVLEDDVKDLEEVTVTGRKADANIRDVGMSTIKLNIASLKKIPVAFGEPDIIRALIMQPGVSTVGEGAGGFNVRGGRIDQNLVLLDGATIFNTSHLLGFFTSVSPDVIQDATLYKGDVPAGYGGRLSSLLVMNTRQGDFEKWNFNVGVGTLTARAVASGPIIKDKLSLLVGFRGAYPNYIIQAFPKPTSTSRAFFYDANAKMEWKITENSRVSASFYQSFDTFKFPEDTSYSWGTRLLSARWSQRFSPKFSTNVSVASSQYFFNIRGLDEGIAFLLKSDIAQQDARATALWQPHERHKLEFGGTFTKYAVLPADMQPVGEFSQINPVLLENENADEKTAFLQYDWTISPRISIQAGLRQVWYAYKGAKTVFQYAPEVPMTPESQVSSKAYAPGEVIQKYGGLEPRFSAKFETSKASSIKLSYNRSRQYLHLISNTTATTPADFWKLSDTFIPPQLSDQFAVGFFKNFNDNGYETSVEVYYKKLNDLVEYKQGATLLLNKNLETALLPSDGYGYGVELNFTKKVGKLTGQMGYTYARSLIRVITPFALENINNGDFYPSNFDKPHTINVTGQIDLGKGWNFGSNFTYTSGRPATYPDGQYVYQGAFVINFSARNLDRIPNYHRLDLSISKDTRKDKKQKKYSIANFSLYNFYARENAYSIYFKRLNLVTRSYRLSVLGTIIPSFTWSRQF